MTYSVEMRLPSSSPETVYDQAVGELRVAVDVRPADFPVEYVLWYLEVNFSPAVLYVVGLDRMKAERLLHEYSNAPDHIRSQASLSGSGDGASLAVFFREDSREDCRQMYGVPLSPHRVQVGFLPGLMNYESDPRPPRVDDFYLLMLEPMTVGKRLKRWFKARLGK